MITTDLEVNQIAGNDLLAFDSRLSGIDSAAQDKRSEPRNSTTFQLKCETYNAESDTFEISYGIVHNYSTNGLYFETKNSFQPSEPVCLSLKDRLSGECDGELAIGVHAQVVWCKLLNTGFNHRYGIGVKYFEPIESHIESH
jgi:hypothetical protein